jgi:cytochrome bd-type quinol oxidase subunit 2
LIIPPPDRRTIWLSIIASVVASILFGIFLQPITTGISNVIVSIIGVFYGGYIDLIYDNAAENPIDYVVLLTFFMIMVLPLIILFYLVMLTYRLATGRPTPFWSSVISMVPLAYFIAGISIFPLLIMSAGITISIKANATFQRQLMALAPVISEQETKELRRQWAMMKSKTDYAAINSQIDALAAKYHTELPTR